MELGNFSVSLSVRDLAASKAFYEKLGFETFGGDGHAFVIMRNGTATIGLFHGMFEGNILTFNPGWGPSCETLEEFADVREIHARLAAEGIEFTADETVHASEEGPASFVVVDPDGNPILVDQHV
jgi:catechol 2,3-dioxygenase-like lactoylglutathione lyase family enzyme